MEIEEEIRDGIIIVTISGMLDASNYLELDNFVQEKYNAGIRTFIFNLQQLEYMSSAGVRVFIKSYRTLSSDGGSIAFSSLQPFVLEIFDIAGLASKFQIFPDDDSALGALSG